MPRVPAAQGRLNHDPGSHLSCDENLSEGWGPPLAFNNNIFWQNRAVLAQHRRQNLMPLRPIMLHDNSGHSVWVNSEFLRLFGIDADTPDLSRNLSHFVRDENGEPTGWVKEFSLLPYFGDRFVPDADELKERLLKYLNYMSSRGITTLWDAGNFNMDDAVYQAAHDIAREGNLPLRWEGAHHIWAPAQIETAVESLIRLRETYAHGKLQFNSIKIHYDGLQDILTAAMLEPYVTDPDNYGGVLFTTKRLSGFMQELDAHRIDLHMHASGDRATRNILDAVKEARDALGRPLGIEVTISHLFSVADSDVARFQELACTPTSRRTGGSAAPHMGTPGRSTWGRSGPAGLSSSGSSCGKGST